MGNGEDVIFDGHIWHGSRNTSRWGARTALLLQYATPSTPIRIPDVEANYEWPFKFLDHPKAPCIMVRGIDRFAQNRIVPAPSANPVLRRATLNADTIWPSWTKRLGDLNLSENEATGWNYHPVFKGSTAFMAQLTVHVSKLSLGAEPHPPHEHTEEELIVILSGETEIVKVDDTPEQSTTVQRIGQGSFVYHSAYQRHTIRAVGSGPATYLIFKWLGKGASREEPWMQSSIFHMQDRASLSNPVASEAIAMKRVFASRTRYLDRLHSHVTTLQPGASYSPHRDPYDVAIVVLSGIVKTLGHRVGPHGVIFYAAGEPHGMQNVGDTPANYLVFEFHGIDVRRRLPQLRGATAQLWRNRVRRLNRRLRRAARRLVSAATSISLRSTTG